MFEIIESGIPGLFRFKPAISKDFRGEFVKYYHARFFEEHGLETNFGEVYYSVSNRHVLRGLHFQVPPADLTKIVVCMRGKITDIVIDIRVSSPTYGECRTFNLNDQEEMALYVPSGMAHGFYVESPDTLVHYLVSKVYDPILEKGIHWRSAESCLPDIQPIVSVRDESAPMLHMFDSPFVYRH